jgi:hypothetical protein
MAKAQHASRYLSLPKLLRLMREEAQLTQRELRKRLRRPQSWIYNCETANRRVDVTEFIGWSRACGMEPAKAFERVLHALK